MIKTKEEILSELGAVVGDRTDDEAITLVEDIMDTLESLAEGADWRAKYEESEKSWREKYIARFFDVAEEAAEAAEELAAEESAEEAGRETFEELFKIEED